jgi:hypothetical protein
MITDTGTPLTNLLGFITGFVLYGMLLWMVFTSRRELKGYYSSPDSLDLPGTPGLWPDTA